MNNIAPSSSRALDPVGNGELSSLIDPKECSICLETFNSASKVVKLNPCRHFFHPPCIETWRAQNKSCPLCRAEIVSLVNVQEGEPAERKEARSREVVIKVRERREYGLPPRQAKCVNIVCMAIGIALNVVIVVSICEGIAEALG